MADLTDKSHLSAPDRLPDPLPTAELFAIGERERMNKSRVVPTVTVEELVQANDALRSHYKTLQRQEKRLKKRVADLNAKLAERDAHWQARIRELEQKLEERELAMHMRIRAEYDTTVAECWREKVAKLEQAAEARERQVREVLREYKGYELCYWSGFDGDVLVEASVDMNDIARELGIDLGDGDE